MTVPSGAWWGIFPPPNMGTAIEPPFNWRNSTTVPLTIPQSVPDHSGDYIQAMKDRCRDAGIIGFLTGTLEGLKWQVAIDDSIRERIQSALDRAKAMESE